ncbi:MAG: hypothetical protein WDZ47_08810 [Bacteroidales bacterium]
MRMAQYSELPVYKATYDFLLAIFQLIKEFSEEYKYTVGESLKKETNNPPFIYPSITGEVGPGFDTVFAG